MIKLKKRIVPLYEHLATYISNAKIKRTSDRVAYVFLAADYNNIGDLAITYAQEKFIEKIYPDYQIISIPITDTYKYLKDIKRNLKPSDLILIQGGGNFGDLYPKADYGRNFVCEYFANHQILSFPQTMVFTNTEYGKWRLKKTRTALSGNNIMLSARERVSYKMMRNVFGEEKVVLSPDIVLSLLPSTRQKSATKSRNSVVLTLRSDGEKKVTPEQQALLQDMVKNNYENVVYRDTEFVGRSPKTTAEGYKRVQDILDVYAAAKVVITDRLHGMIFATISGTTCIVLPNSNHKISETYNNWLSKCNYIKFVNSVNVQEIKEVIDHFSDGSFRTNYNDITISFKELESALRKIVRN